METIVVVDRQSMRPDYFVEEFDSFIVTEQYNGAGDFEFILETQPEVESYFVFGKLLKYGTEKYGRIEKVSRYLDSNGDFKTKVTGRTLEIILAQRVIWGRRVYTTYLDQLIKMLVFDNFTNPEPDGYRKMTKFAYKDTKDPRILSKPVSGIFVGNNVYTLLQEQCEKFDVGFKIVIENTNILTLSLYCGTTRPEVEFSLRNESLISYSVTEDYSAYKNAAIVGGYGDGAARKYAYLGTSWDEDRYETFIDGGRWNPDLGGGNVMSDSDYTKLLTEVGNKELATHSPTRELESEIDPYSFIYGDDYELGDIVYVRTPDGARYECLVKSAIISIDGSGRRVLPKFKVVQKKNGPGGWLF